jgi:hypothetical protein
MAYRVELPPDKRYLAEGQGISGRLFLPKITGESGDGGDVITEGRIIAVKICSKVLQAHIWLSFDNFFDPKDGQAVFYPDEIRLLATKDAETLREVQKVKLAFPGSRARQRKTPRLAEIIKEMNFSSKKNPR